MIRRPPESRPESRPESLIAIDLLRLACAMIVVCYHFFAANAWQPIRAAQIALADVAIPTEPTRLFWWGWVGVPIFFAISGYVIAGSAIGMRAGPFLFRRAMRLYPTTWICASVTAMLLMVEGQGGLPLLVVWLYGMMLSSESWLLDGSYWTLPLELAFYLVVATVLAIRGAGKGAGKGAGSGSDRWLETTSLMLGAIGLAFAVAVPPGSLPLGRVVGMFVAHAAEFALGMTIAAIHRHGASPGRVIAACGWFGVTLLTVARHAAASSVAMHVEATAAWPLAVLSIGVAVLATAPGLQPVLRRCIAADVARIAGLTTFPLYLIHQAAGAILIGALVRAGTGYAIAALMAMGAALAFAVAVACRIEPPFRRALVRRLTRSHAPAPDRFRTASPPTG